MTKTAPAFSISDFKAAVATEASADFEPLLADGSPSGLVLQVKSDLAPSVHGRLMEMMDAFRDADTLRAAQAAKARPGHAPVEKTASIVRNSHRMAAVRVCGWNAKDEFSEAALIDLFAHWPDLVAQVLAKSAELASFTPTSPKA